MHWDAKARVLNWPLRTQQLPQVPAAPQSLKFNPFLLCAPVTLHHTPVPCTHSPHCTDRCTAEITPCLLRADRHRMALKDTFE